MERHELVYILILLLIAVPAFAGEMPAACAPKEDPIVCMLKVERNNALDELAISQGQRHMKATQEEALARWWGEYVKGMDDQILWWRSYAEGMSHAQRK